MSYIRELTDEAFRLREVDEWWKDLLSQDVGHVWQGTEEANFRSEDGFDPIVAGQRLPWGESHAADLIAERLEHLLEYEDEAGLWYIWEGRVHRPLSGDLVALEVVDNFYRQYERALDYVQWWLESEIKVSARGGTESSRNRVKVLENVWKKDFAKHRKFRDRMQGHDGRKSLTRDMKTKMSISPDRYADDTQWFVCRNGVIDCNYMRDSGEFGALLPHDPARNVTRWFDADYDPEVNLGHWDMFLKESIPEEGMRKYLQAALGAAFSGEKKLRTYLIFNGKPSSGKSLFLETFGELGEGGSGYVYANASSDAIIKQSSGKNFSRASFGNRRLIGVSEPDSDAKLDGDFLKEFTGDSRVTLEAKYGQPSQVIAQGLLIIATNELPRIDSSDNALLKRTKIVDFPYSFMESEETFQSNTKVRIPNLNDLLLEDRSRILTWVLEGMYMYYNGEETDSGLVKYSPLETSSPESMNRLIHEHKQELQTPIQWVEFMVDNGALRYESNPEALELYSGRDFLSTGKAHKAYKAWMIHIGESHPFGSRKFIHMILDEYGIDGYSTVKKAGENRFPVLLPTNKYNEIVSEFEQF